MPVYWVQQSGIQRVDRHASGVYLRARALDTIVRSAAAHGFQTRNVWARLFATALSAAPVRRSIQHNIVTGVIPECIWRMDTLTNLYDEHSDWLSPTVSVYRGRNPSCGVFMNECPVTGVCIFTYSKKTQF